MLGGRSLKVVPIDATPWPWPWPIPAAEPGLVACPMPMAVPGGSPALMQEMYRLAYERAVALARPSRYEQARHGSMN